MHKVALIILEILPEKQRNMGEKLLRLELQTGEKVKLRNWCFRLRPRHMCS